MKKWFLDVKNKIRGEKPQRIQEFLRKNPLIVIVFCIFGLAIFLRLWQISVIPGGFSEYERQAVDQLLKFNKNNLWLGGEFDKAAYLHLAFFVTKIFGLKIIVLRILSAIIGSLTVVMLYVFISQWFSKKVAVFASLLLAISAFHITLSRLILPDIMFPLILLIIFSTITLAYRTKNPWYFGISGMLVGLGFYTSPAFLFIPILFAVSAIYFYLKNKKFLTIYKKELLVAVVGFLAVIAPFLVSFAREPMAYLTHFGFYRSPWQLVMNVGQIPNLLFFGTPKEAFSHLGTEPLVDPFIFVTATSGFLLALFSITRRKYFFLVFWVVFLTLYAALKRGVQVTDLIGILPALYVMAALMIDYVLVKWLETFPLNKNARLLIVAVFSLLFALSGLYNFDQYFVAYKNSKDVKTEFSAKSPIPLK